MIHQLCSEIIKGNNIREHLISLNKEIKDEQQLDRFLDVYYEHESLFNHFLDHEDAKVRKNAIKLLGRVADPVLLETLLNHYMNEETQFLKSEYLYALACFDYKEQIPMFNERLEVLSKEPMTKHSIEEMKALRSLIWKEEPPKKHSFTYSSSEEKVLLVVPRGHESMVMEELEQIPDTQAKSIVGGCIVKTKHLSEVRKIRTYQAILFDFYPANIESLDGKNVGEMLLNHNLMGYLGNHFKEKYPFVFRVDVKGIKEINKKNQLAYDISSYLENNSQGMLINDSSYYEIEIRVIANPKGCRVFLRFAGLSDPRFTYRKYAMSTSMQPAKAALMMRYLKPYMKEDANVLDPFCGTGTLLIERAFSGKVKSLYGLDISEPAIQAAWDNSQRAGKVINLVQRNFNDFKHEYVFDEIITDMPRQTGTIKQRQVEYVYQLLFVRSRELLAENGILAVYCEDEYLMERYLKESPWLKRCKKIVMTKDKTSFIYILQKLYN